MAALSVCLTEVTWLAWSRDIYLLSYYSKPLKVRTSSPQPCSEVWPTFKVLRDELEVGFECGETNTFQMETMGQLWLK